jgi:CHAD domain-containing protein
MSTVVTLSSGARLEHRGISYWMDRTLKELETVRASPDADGVHDLRVAIRHCRSIASVMEEVDKDPAWPEMRKAGKKLFRGLGTLRDAHVMQDLVRKLAPAGDPVREQFHAASLADDPGLREGALRSVRKFDEKSWRRLERHLRQRARLIPTASLAAECLALERLEEAKELHARALRTESAKPWHALRIGLKRFRYTVAGFLPEHYAQWGEHLKRLQDTLGEIHDLDVLAVAIKRDTTIDAADILNAWSELISRERRERFETYRKLTLGKTSFWNEWRNSLPHNGRLEAAGLARLFVTARAADTHPGRTARDARIAVALFERLRRAGAAPLFADDVMRRILRAAARLHVVGNDANSGSPQKSARKYLLKLTIPPGWKSEEWELLAWSVRYYRGAEPVEGKGAFSRLLPSQQQNIRAIAGVLRLARALRKSGVESGAGIRAENSGNAILLTVPNLSDTAESAAKLAVGKHLLETFLQLPIVLKSVSKPEKTPPLQMPSSEPLRLSTAMSD